MGMGVAGRQQGQGQGSGQGQSRGNSSTSVHRPVKGEKAASDASGGFLLSPSVQRALEGVHYIADHLRAEDADFSVSGLEKETGQK